MRTLLYSAALAVVSAQTPVLVGRGESLLPWSLQCGAPTCALQLSSDTTPWSGLPYLNLSFNLGPQDWSGLLQLAYDQVDTALRNIPEPAAVSMSIYFPAAADNHNQITVEIADATGKNFGTWPMLQPGWNNVTFNLNGGFLPAGTIQGPLTGISFGANRYGNGTYGWLGFADIAIVSNASAADIPMQLRLAPLQPRPDTSGVLVAGNTAEGPVSAGVQVVNRLPADCTAQLTVRMRNSSGVMGEGEGDGGSGSYDSWIACTPPGGVAVAGWSAVNASCTLDAAVLPAGYYLIQAIFNGSTCWHVNDTQQVVEVAVAVVLPQPPYTPVLRNVRPNVFGGQMEPNAASAARIGMVHVRSGPLWRWAQPDDCWNLTTCFHWQDYDGVFALSAAGIEVMIDAREIAPPYAAAKNDSGPSWAEFPGPSSYPAYQQYLTIMLDRYGAMATTVEVSNEIDGLAYFQPSPIPLNYSIQLAQDLTNITAAAIAASANGTGLKLVGMASSMFDIKQAGNGGSTFAYWERAVLNAPGQIAQLDAVSCHPYQNGAWVPWIQQSWGNVSFMYANETTPPSVMQQNSTVGQLLTMVGLMEEAAAAAGLGPGYKPVLRPSEVGYAYAIPWTSSSGWTFIHAALVAQTLLHMRSYPLAQWVEKVDLFAAYDGCCEESNTFFGIWRPVQLRTGPNATAEYLQPTNLASILPLPAVSAYATASVLLDVPSGRAPGVFVLDHSQDGASAPAGQQLPPSCVAFEAAQAGVQPLAALFLVGHHYNDRTTATGTLPSAGCGGSGTVGVAWTSGLGAPLPLSVSGCTITLNLASLPSYLTLPVGSSATDFCNTLKW